MAIHLPVKALKQIWTYRLHFLREQILFISVLNAENKPEVLLSVCQSLLANMQTDLAYHAFSYSKSTLVNIFILYPLQQDGFC